MHFNVKMFAHGAPGQSGADAARFIVKQAEEATFRNEKQETREADGASKGFRTFLTRTCPSSRSQEMCSPWGFHGHHVLRARSQLSQLGRYDVRFKGEDRNALDKWLLLEVGGFPAAAKPQARESTDLKLRWGLSPMSTRTWCWPETCAVAESTSQAPRQQSSSEAVRGLLKGPGAHQQWGCHARSLECRSSGVIDMNIGSTCHVVANPRAVEFDGLIGFVCKDRPRHRRYHARNFRLHMGLSTCAAAQAGGTHDPSSSHCSQEG